MLVYAGTWLQVGVSGDAVAACNPLNIKPKYPTCSTYGFNRTIQSYHVRLLRTKVILKLDHGTNHSYEFTELGSSCIRCFLGATGAPAQQRHRKLRCRIDPGGLSVPFCSVTLSELSHGHMVKKYPANTAQSKLSTKQVARSFYQLWPQLLHKMQAVFHVF